MKLFSMFKKAAVGLVALLFATTTFAQIAAPTSFGGITFGADITSVTGQTLTEVSVPNNKSGLKTYTTTGGAVAPGATTLSNVNLFFKNGKFQGGRGTASVTSSGWATIQAAADTTFGPQTQVITGITRTGSTATVAKNAHGYTNGDFITISGAAQTDYNIGATISNVSTNAFDYTVANSPVTPATGTISATKTVGPYKTNVVQHTTYKKWRAVSSNVSTELLLSWNSTTSMLTYSVRKY